MLGYGKTGLVNGLSSIIMTLFCVQIVEGLVIGDTWDSKHSE